jgi:oligoendopeptidase F
MTISQDRPYVPQDFDPSDFANIEPLGRELLQRPVKTPADLRRWLADLSELWAFISEAGSRRNIQAACHTDDPQIEARFLHWVREIQPRLAPLFFEIQKRYLALPVRQQTNDPALALMGRQWEADVSIFRPANIPLFTRQSELAKDYGKITGSMTVEFRGHTYTLQQLARFLEEPDRSTRQEAWELMTRRRLQDRDRLDDLFDELLGLRHQLALNADFDNFRQYAWIEKNRFDYTPDDCLDFGDAVEKICVPLVEQLDLRRRQELGLDTLRPWDASVDPHNRPPLRPFDETDINHFVDGCTEIFQRFAPVLAEQFKSLKTNGDLDLESRKAKRPGGFQASLEHVRRPFIFMNAAGLHRDIETLLHEGGHAFHYLHARDIENIFLRHAPLEFCEVASMVMELLGCEHFNVFYPNPLDAARAKRQQLEGIIRLLPWIATIDGFQHWLYTHPGHSRAQRTQAWLDLLERFGSSVVDWTGYEPAHEAMWQRQGHLYNAPFYYIEYGIAQLGSMQVWLNHRQNPADALNRYLSALSLGGTKPLPDLFEAAGAQFKFNADTLKPLIDALGKELDTLPA